MQNYAGWLRVRVPESHQLALLAAILIVLAIPANVSAESVLSWTAQPNFPTPIAYESVIGTGGYAYSFGGNACATTDCSGGVAHSTEADSATYSTVTGTLGTFAPMANHLLRQDFGGPCVYDSGYVYCVGGQSDSLGTITNAVESASISAGADSVFTDTTVYPAAEQFLSCVAYSGYIYCVGGGNNGGATANTYYATLTAGVVGTWTATTAYPTTIVGVACVQAGGYIYCMGGNPTTGVNWQGGTTTGAITNSYYAPISSTGIGAWVSTTAIPYHIAIATVLVLNPPGYGSYVYLIGGQVYNSGNNSYTYPHTTHYATLSSSGIGSWTRTTNFPQASAFMGAFGAGAYLFTVGDYRNAAPNYFHDTYSGSTDFTTTIPCNVFQLQCWWYPTLVMSLVSFTVMSVVRVGQPTWKGLTFVFLYSLVMGATLLVMLGLSNFVLPTLLLVVLGVYAWRFGGD